MALEIEQICNNKATIVYHDKQATLFSYGTRIMTRDIQSGNYVRHVEDCAADRILSHTTLRHIKEFASELFDKSIKKEFLRLKYEE